MIKSVDLSHIYLALNLSSAAGELGQDSFSSLPVLTMFFSLYNI